MSTGFDSRSSSSRAEVIASLEGRAAVLVTAVVAGVVAIDFAVSATALAKEQLGNILFANMIMLGGLTRLAGMDFEAMQKAMLEVLPRFHEQNLQALDVGYTLDQVARRA